MANKFDEYLEKQDGKYIKIALTSKSYKNKKQELDDKNTNCELSTYGDALLKLALCVILFEENVDNITEEKKEYESDKILVKVIAKKYNLLEYIHYDENDKKIPRNYEYEKLHNNSTHKFIATTVEALLAAYYLDNNKDFNLIIDLVKKWKSWIENNR
ncbi:MAG: hypothetical protein II984_07385 [Clostridia bacterium]|nr:hypothetical protein [Clostridia bacterium]